MLKLECLALCSRLVRLARCDASSQAAAGRWGRRRCQAAPSLRRRHAAAAAGRVRTGAHIYRYGGVQFPSLHLLRSDAGLLAVTSNRGVRPHPCDAATAHSWTGRLLFSSSSQEFSSERASGCRVEGAGWELSSTHKLLPAREQWQCLRPSPTAPPLLPHPTAVLPQCRV